MCGSFARGTDGSSTARLPAARAGADAFVVPAGNHGAAAPFPLIAVHTVDEAIAALRNL